MTGYGDSIYEPGVPPVKDVFLALGQVSEKYRSHVVVRIDPIVPTPDGIARAVCVYNMAINLGFKTRVSILDLYPHSLRRLQNIEAVARDEIRASMIRVSVDLVPRLKMRLNEYTLNRALESQYSFNGKPTEHLPTAERAEILATHFPNAEVCGEPGITSTGCVNSGVCQALGVEYAGGQKGQRSYCPCGAQKFELLKKAKRCEHSCWYCFWKD